MYEVVRAGRQAGAYTTVVRILPYVVGFVFAISDFFTASGCFDYIAAALMPLLTALWGIPS